MPKAIYVKKLKLAVGTFCLLATITSVVVACITVYRKVAPYLDVMVSDKIYINDEWTKITPYTPLRARRQLQYIVIETAEAFEPDYKSWGLIFNDGSIVH